MSLSRNLQNILDETFNSLLFVDVSLNLSGFSPTTLNTIRSSLNQQLNSNVIPEEANHEEREDEDASIPDLIPVQEESRNTTNEESFSREDTRRRLRLWSNVLLDYNSQMTNYQSNISTILNITENMLPLSLSSSSTNIRHRIVNHNRRNLNHDSYYNRLLQSILHNDSSGYVLELDTTLLPNYTNSNSNSNTRNKPTALQIQTATTLFSYHPQENPLTVSICPITLEEFQENEILMRIQGCGHIFKATALHRWFERNHKCPSCRYDIISSAFSLPTTTTISSSTSTS